jgi:hypothetical protein
MNIRQKIIFLAIATTLAACGNSNPDADSQNDVTSPRNSSDSTDPDGPGGSDELGTYTKDCFWGPNTDPNVVNTLYPDELAIYWVGSLDIPAGGKIRLESTYPHARYSSFNLYNPALQPIDAIADVEILPNPGSSNPSRTGADRTVSAREYTVEIIPAIPPENIQDRLPNTLYSFQGRNGNNAPSQKANIIYRIYLPDGGRDISGDVGLPRVVLVQANGTEISGSDACSALTDPVPTSGANLVADADGPLNVPSTLDIGFADVQWLKFFDLFSAQANRFNANALGPVLNATPANSEEAGGGFASNIHNAYMYTAFDHEIGPVGVFEAPFPSTPRTINGQPVMAAADMRYWSVCTNENSSQRFIDCTYDEDTVIAGGSADRRIFAVTKPSDRPNNATLDCGVNWLAFGPQQETVVIVRHMLPENAFLQSIQRVPGPAGTCEKPTLQKYFPAGTHMSQAEFEALGCPVNPDAIPERDSQFPPSANCS